MLNATDKGRGTESARMRGFLQHADFGTSPERSLRDSSSELRSPGLVQSSEHDEGGRSSVDASDGARTSGQMQVYEPQGLDGNQELDQALGCGSLLETEPKDVCARPRSEGKSRGGLGWLEWLLN
ncbi:hypothetical protein E4U55_000858 [Claviceps digitariae]|nr:hypothetical protein E4U55_000858 [Claviceps digitariae]